VDLPELSDAELDAHLRRTVDLTMDSMMVHFRLHGALGIILGSFAFSCKDVLGWDDDRALGMLTGTSATTTEPARELVELAGIAADSPAIRVLPSDTPLNDVRAADPRFAAAFDEYLNRYCHRALTYDLSDPTLAESPELILRLVRDQVALNRKSAVPGTDAELLITEARSRLKDAPQADRERFESELLRARKAYPVREDNVYLTVSSPFALVRYAALELGKRLCATGQIAEPDDVFYLSFEVAMSALHGNQQQQDLVAQRQNDRRRALTHPGPASYGPQPSRPPSFSALPPEPRMLIEWSLWNLAKMEATEPPGASTNGELRGVAASTGTYTGPVRIVLSEKEFEKVRPGDVLVCNTTSPAWSVVFPSISALITDAGGLLSHPAIVAREFGLPAVVATGTATRVLKDDLIVTVDGTKGTVRIEPGIR
jgi:rifampicin phosphotransferase